MYSQLKNIDKYLVYNDYSYLDFKKELNLLYLPLINASAINLYHFLSSKILYDNNLSSEYNHFDIIDNLGMDTKTIVVSRKKLEALGLLETKYAKQNNDNYYIYILKKPLSFNDFFENPLLSVLLENTIGTESYSQIKSKYSEKKLLFNNFKNISAKFSDVYSHDYNDSYDIDTFSETSKAGPNLDEYYFDMDKLKYLLTGKYMEDVLENKKIVDIILSMAHLYKATPYDMLAGLEKSIDMSLEEYEINMPKLQDYFLQLHTIVKKQQSPTTENMINKKMLQEIYSEEKVLTIEEQYAKKLDSINYIDFLKERYNIIVSNVDSQNIVKLVNKYNLTTGVLNILLDYSLQETKQNTLPYINYLDKVASGWSSKRLISALDAMRLVREQKESKKTIKDKKQTKSFSKTSNDNKRVISSPEYIKEQVATLDNDRKTRVQTEKDLLAHSELMELLKEKGIN